MSWRGQAGPEPIEAKVEEIQGIPKQRKRNPERALQEYKRENKRLKMENALLQSFILLTGRKRGQILNIKSCIAIETNIFQMT